MNRRTYIKTSTAWVGAATLGFWNAFTSGNEDRRFKIGACDWSIGQRGRLEAFEVGRSIGLDGVQVSYNTRTDEKLLENPTIQKAYLDMVTSQNMAMGGIALGILNEIPYKSEKIAEEWVLNSIDVAKNMGVKVILLAFFGKGDIKEDPEGRKMVVERLKKAAPKAEDAGIYLGIESWLSAREHVDIIEAVGSDHVKVYYDVANSHKMGYDIYEEIRWLGKELICEFHAKENGYLLGRGLIDFREVRRAIDDIGYSGWIQIEGAIPEGAQMLESYLENNRFMREIFHD